MASTIAALTAGAPSADTTELVTELVASSLRSIGLFDGGARTIGGLALKNPPAPYYERWLSATIAYLQQEKVLTEELAFGRPVRALEDVWVDWDARHAARATNPSLHPQRALLEACLRALPGILSGTTRPMDVIFPDSSPRLVEAVYRDNVQTDHFNDVLGETLAACIEMELEAGGDQAIRILEIGAGTGGTTGRVLPMLRKYPVDEYCFTDVSKAFLLHAEREFRQQFPALTTAIFDVTRPLGSQSISAGRYDFVIAANVLHATADIRQALRNAKATLRDQGVLLLNEISAWSVFNHVTFGLLEGWWPPEDTVPRLPGCPGLAPAAWQEILADEGFESIRFPAEDAHQFGQQIVVAVSDGWTRQPIVSAAAPPVERVDPPPARAMAAEERPLTGTTGYVRGIIAEQVAAAVGMDRTSLRDAEPLASYGVDSIIGVGLLRSIAESLRIELEPTSLFEYGTLGQLTRHVVDRWGDQIAAHVGTRTPPSRNDQPPVRRFVTEPQLASDVVPSIAPPQNRTERIAIIGMSGRFGESESLDVFWQNLAEGRELMKDVSRWHPSECAMSVAAERYCSRGGFVDSIDRFDPEFFGIAPQEAAYMDPQQRLFLEESWRALEDAGYAGECVHEKRCAVYVGCGSAGYDRSFVHEPPAQAFWGNAESVTPARIAYHLNLQGPAVAVDTACSSSLVAIHLACQSLWTGDTDLALAGGVFLQPTPRFYQAANRAGMLSPDGRCYSLDARANGFVPGEGVGVVVLKRLDDALNDRDHIHGVIIGSGLNQDGKSNGLIAPNGLAQERLTRSVYDRFQINPESIQAIEAHATGTVLGDSVEYAALTRSFRSYTDKKGYCAIGTLKANIGHTASAAGVAAVLKLLLSLRHRQIPPVLYTQQPNPAVHLDSGPFYVNDELKPWSVEPGQVRRAAVSAFGFSGTNAHLVLEEAPGVVPTPDSSPRYLLVLSARTAQQLQQQARQLLAHVQEHPELSMNDCSFSLLVGRTHFNHRLCCLAGDRTELIRLLGQWVDTGSAERVYTSEIQESSRREQASLKSFGNYCLRECGSMPSPATFIEHLATIADLYLQGYALDFPAMFSPESRRTPLPTYPFANERHWSNTVPAVGTEAPATPAVSAAPVVAAVAAVTGPGADLLAWVEHELLELASGILNVPSDAVPREQILLEHGFDSVGLTTFARAISERFHVDVTPVLFFSYPSIREIAAYFSRERSSEIMQAASPDTTSDHRTSAPVRQSRERDRRLDDEAIAIVGISGVMPQSEDLDEFWDHLQHSRDLVTVIPRDRWRWEDYDGDPLKDVNKSSSKWGGFMKEVDKFDPLFFGISPREAELMDPQQRIFLEHAWKAIEDAGQKVSTLAGTRTGVFVGVAANEYVEVLRDRRVPLDGYAVSGNSHAILANRVSFLLNLRGPSEPVDTACSSSLVAVHRAVESIRTGRCDMALAGGVQILLNPGAYISFSAAGMLSTDGKCKAFDKRANGYVRGEGCGVVFLKRLSAAEADGDSIYAVIKATAENHGGRVTTMTAPNPVAQAELLVEAYEEGQVDPAAVGYIECHGTGTSLGDPIEIQSLVTAFADLYRRRHNSAAPVPHCGLSTVKSNIGHLETAAGIAGLLKAVLAIKHKQIPASIHFEEINPYINLKGTPFYIADRLTPWDAPQGAGGAPEPRVAGVSSFGFGGVNAHVVLQEYVQPKRRLPARAAGAHVIVLSAKNEERLKAYVRSMLKYLDRADVELADVAYTLQVGRDEMSERLAVIASSIADLRQKLGEYLAGAAPLTGTYQENTRRRRPGASAAEDVERNARVQSLIDRNDLSGLAQVWVSGGRVDWQALYKTVTPRRLSLPGYPFARERHWPASADALSDDARREVPLASSALHPMVHRNVSTPEAQKFVSRFSGDEFYVADHGIDTQKILTGVAYLEMARAAGELSGRAKVRVIRNVTWQRPLAVGKDGTDVEISLAPAKDEVAFSIKTGLDGHVTTHCAGKLSYAAEASPSVVDIAAIRARCPRQVFSRQELYGDMLAGAGLNLGENLQIAQRIYANPGESLAILQLPDALKDGVDQFELHPALLEGALHASFGLMKANGLPEQMALLYSVGEVRLFGSLRDAKYAYATSTVESQQAGQPLPKVHIQVLSGEGTVLVRMKDIVVRPLARASGATAARSSADAHRTDTDLERAAASLQSLVPVWNPALFDTSRLTAPLASTRILLVGGTESQLDWVRLQYPNSQLLPLFQAASIDSIADALGECAFDQVLWLAPDVTRDAPLRRDTDEPIVDQQERGVLAVFRISKALLQSGRGSTELQWTFLTSRTQPVIPGDSLQPTHAGVVGFVGCLAKEHANWNIRLLDVESLASVSARECLSLPWDPRGEPLAHRGGEWFRPGVARIETLPETAPVYRHKGVYVVIGGAGGVGEVWSRYMIEAFQANIVWIGRREYDSAIGRKIDALAGFGNAPLYISADARDPQALQLARDTILRKYGVIHGVVHSAVVLHDQAVARMDEAAFRASLSPKIDICASVDRVFGSDALDFMLFFSSIASLAKAPWQSSYSAGCTFKDSFAHALRQERSYRVRVINWGYWGAIGVVADETYKQRMAQVGIASIEPREGMEALRRLMSSDVAQMVLVKTRTPDAAAGLNLAEALTYYHDRLPAILPEIQIAAGMRDSTASLAPPEPGASAGAVNGLVTEILASTLLSLGLFRDGVETIAQLAPATPPAAYFEHWLRGTVDYLRAQRWLGERGRVIREPRPLSGLWAEWEEKRAVWTTDSDLAPHVALIEACLKALPAVLSGKQRATDVMFPNSSMRLVEGVYRGNALADYFNDALRATLIACLERLERKDANARFRILEIGAGTGGTTAHLLPALQRFPIEEYCYTDVSKAFLMHAQDRYRPQFPPLTTAIFDVSQPIASQSIVPARYDVAIAANVLHATPNIRETLRNAKAALKNGGVLLLNEVSAWSLFSHVTFGLLEGWWLYEDRAVRLAGSPAVAPEKWRALLAEEGFESILFPVEQAHRFGQQIIAAASNGWTRQRIAAKPVPERAAAGDAERVKGAAVPPPKPSEEASDYVRRIVIDHMSAALKIDASLIHTDTPFDEYGVDSIVGVNLVQTINEALQIELETVSLFEYTTIDQIVDHICTNWPEQIAPHFDRAPVVPLAEPAPPPEPAAARDSEERESAASELTRQPIAIIGMSGRFAESESLDEFWQHLAQGKNLVKEVSRWSTAESSVRGRDGELHRTYGSFVDSFDCFDPAFFRISAEQAVYMDPQQRLFLEESWKALEDAGYAGKSMHERACGVYVGASTSDYERLCVAPTPEAVSGNSECMIPSRVAYHFNLQGPAITVDTSCSSSLVAVHLACQSLWSGETEMALAGGVSIQATPGVYEALERSGMLSSAGKCFSFDARADGFVLGEAVGVLVLKRLSDARRDGDHIHGVIAGSGLNQDGSSTGITAPNGRAQERLERTVYDRFKIDPATIQVVEAHGTATPLGDSIELRAMTRAFRAYTDRRQFCAVGTVKTNIGHANTAAGIAGLLKMLLALKHRQLPPSLNFQTINPAIELESGPFYINTALKEWTVDGTTKRRAAVNAFGANGTNAHLVLEEAPSIERTRDEAPGYVVPLSALTSQQLRRQVENLLVLAQQTPDLSMNDLSFTLFVGRGHFSHRFSCVARGRDELIRTLERWLEGGTASQVYTHELPEGRVREQATLKKFGNHCIEQCRSGTDDAVAHLEYLATVADLYAQGYSLDFRLLFPKRSRRVPLPTYPFARDRYWVEPVAPAAVESTMPVPDVVASVRHDEVIAPNETVTRRLDVAPRADYVAPRTELERQLVEIWAEVLDLAPDAIGVNDGFFELGGHSVWAAEIILAIRDRLALELAPTAMFEAFTVAELAELLRDQSAEGRAAATLHEENAASQPASLVVSTST